jgi:hypothetical protein
MAHRSDRQCGCLELACCTTCAIDRLKAGGRLARTTIAIERLHEELKCGIKTRAVLPSSETAAMLFWALLAPGQITMRKVGGWQTFYRDADQLVH